MDDEQILDSVSAVLSKWRDGVCAESEAVEEIRSLFDQPAPPEPSGGPQFTMGTIETSSEPPVRQTVTIGPDWAEKEAREWLNEEGQKYGTVCTKSLATLLLRVREEDAKLVEEHQRFYQCPMNGGERTALNLVAAAIRGQR